MPQQKSQLDEVKQPTEIQLSSDEHFAEQQIELFGLSIHTKEAFRNLVFNYELIPFYETDKSRQQPTDKKDFERHNHFKLENNRTWKLTRQPAMLIDNEGSSYAKYPGAKERSIMDAFIALAQQECYPLGPYIGVPFYWRDLIRECGKYNISEIREGVSTLLKAPTVLECLNPGDEQHEQVTWESPQLKDLIMTGDPKNPVDDGRALVVMHALIKDQVLSIGYRQYNQQTNKGLTSSIAPYLHKRLSAMYTQASTSSPYEVWLSTLRSWANLLSTEGMSISVAKRPVLKALDELVASGVLQSYEVIDERKGRKQGSRKTSVLDMKMRLVPTTEFIAEQKRASAIHADIRLRNTLLELGEITLEQAKSLDHDVIKSIASRSELFGADGMKQIDVSDDQSADLFVEEAQ